MSESVRDKIRDNPASFKCCFCKAEMPKRISATGGDGQLKRGTVIICSECAHPNVLGDSDLHPMTKDEFFTLDQPTQKAILTLAKGIKQLVESGGSWHPYQNQ